MKPRPASAWGDPSTVALDLWSRAAPQLQAGHGETRPAPGSRWWWTLGADRKALAHTGKCPLPSRPGAAPPAVTHTRQAQRQPAPIWTLRGHLLEACPKSQVGAQVALRGCCSALPVPRGHMTAGCLPSGEHSPGATCLGRGAELWQASRPVPTPQGRETLASHQPLHKC